MLIDNDEEMEHMCHKCIDEATSNNRCTRCGTVMSKIDSFVNPQFDKSRFEALARDDDSVTVNKNFDTDKFNRLDGGD